ncbi:hypothetical protein [Nannocystis pusilla]|uniref:Secreted protein n=1 Tax=Nannocystis pusilla TaxID=889268 RepID=A0ABS7TS84_9BACT|nr:hypothetical protein [Nannocystis pusilla]MBZ5711090.1 hypothetical protein [Nannocystis pusilla]
MSPPVGSAVVPPSVVVPLLVGASPLASELDELGESAVSASAVELDVGEQPPTSAAQISEDRRLIFLIMFSG